MLQQLWSYFTQANAQITAYLAPIPLLQSFYGGARTLLIIFLMVFTIEWFAGGQLRRYLTRNFRTDVLYGLMYTGGIYGAVIYAPLIALLAFIVPSWHYRLVDHLSGVAGFVAFWLITDFAGYWIHRLYHTSNLMWTFHKVHHAQTELTFVTSFRNHVIEQVASNVIMFVPAMLIGVPVWVWGPVFLLQNLFEGLQHSDIKWRYGPLYPIFVSPVFHAIHHSPERARHDSNYGKILSVWDYLFGTISVGERPARYGLAGDQMPISFVGTLAAPFVELWRKRWHSLPSATPGAANRDPTAT